MDLEGEHAIRLIQVNSSGKYILSEEGKAFISKIQGPIGVISVAGMYRTGKSYLLNRMLLNRSNGFGVGPTVNPCTKGLWCWGKTILGKTVQGESINVIVIDTQGIGALDQDQTHDTRIFTLAILSASAFIYNSTGSIDQNALQNLSLVVNLTKNIQLNTSNSEQQQDDPEELAEYFPAFYWVVRDFSLQLVNSQGNQISPKEYLERALAPQKGFSDDVEQKNRIRRLLSSFFKERQCFTLVRPLVDEKKLQNLDRLQLDTLRPEFVDQVMNFRKRILGRVRPKMFKGKQLDGPMYLCLLSSYVTAINNGAVPNIQNAWIYMCQQKCAQAFEQSVSFFNEQAEKVFKNADNNGIDEHILIQQIKHAKQKACDLFELNSVGDRTKFHLKQLRQKLEHKSELYRLENQKISQSTLKSFFKKAILPIQNRLRVKQYLSFDEFNKQLNQFYLGLLQNGPLLPKKQSVYLSLIKKVIPTAAQIFLRDKNQQLKNLKSIFQQKQTSSQFLIEQLKAQMKQIEEKSKQKISKLDREKIECQLQTQDHKRTIQDLKQKCHIQTQKWQSQSKSMSDIYKKKQQILNDKLGTLNNHINELQAELMSVKCSQQKQLALITLKNKQLQSQVQETKKKQHQTMLTLKSLQVSSNNNIKQITYQYQLKIKEKDSELRNLKTNANQLQQQIKVIELQFTRCKTQNEEQLTKLKNTLAKKQNQLTKLQKERQDFEKQTKVINEDESNRLKQEVTTIAQKCAQAEKQLKILTETNFSKQRNYETELILQKQKIQFIELQAKQYKNQLLKAKKEHEQKISALLQQSNLRENQSAKFQQQTQLYEQKISHLKSDHEQIQKKLANQVQQLTKQVSQMTLQLKSVKSKSQMLLDQNSYTIKQLQLQLQSQQGDTSSKMTSIHQQFKIKQKNYIQKIQKLQNEMQQIKEQLAREQREQHQKSEETLLQLKNYYEIEKDKLESKIVNEKDKYQRKLSQLKAQYQQKIRQEITELQSQYQFLKQKFGEIQEELMKEKTNRKIQVDIKNKQIQNLQKTNEQIKSKIDNKEVELLNKIDRLQKEQSTQKQTLYAKLEQLLNKQSRIQKQKTSLANSKEQLDKLLHIRQTQIQELKSSLSILKDKVQNDKQLQKTARNDINTKLMYDRVEFEKKIALLSQENLHLKQKIQQNEKYIENNQMTQQDRLKKLKQDYGHQLRTARQKHQMELQTIEAKYEKIKKTGKQKQSQLQKCLNQAQKQLAIVTQKNISLSDRLKTYQQKQLIDSDHYSQSLSVMKANFMKQKQTLKQQLQTEQKQRQRIQSQKNNQIANYQQQKLLMQNKYKFLEEAKERIRQDYEETKTKLQQVVENSRKRWTQEKTSLELVHSQYISKVQKKYWQQKQQASDNFKKQETQYQNKLRNLESQNRVLSEKLAIEQQNKMGTQNASQRRLKQVSQNEKKLQAELDRIKVLRQSEQFELQNFQKQKQNLKLKIKQKQQKYRTLQKQKQNSYFETEKQKAKWKAENDNIKAKVDQQKQIITKQEKDIQKLQRQNQKLKVQKKCQKTSMQSMTRFSSGYGLDRRQMSRSTLEESVLKQNSNNSSQISDTSLFFKQ